MVRIQIDACSLRRAAKEVHQAAAAHHIHRPLPGQRQSDRLDGNINAAMIGAGRDRMLDEGRLAPAIQCNAEALPFAARSFDCVSIAFGLTVRWPAGAVEPSSDAAGRRR